jgi:hypothetical protein
MPGITSDLKADEQTVHVSTVLMCLSYDLPQSEHPNPEPALIVSSTFLL